MAHWTEHETSLLIDLWREDTVFEEVASKNTRSKKVYDRIADRLSTLGHKKTEKQVRSKIKNLKSEFKKVRDTLRTSGEAAIPKGKYYDLIAEIIGGRPSVDPPEGSVLESTRMTTGTGEGDSSATTSMAESDNDDDIDDLLDEETPIDIEHDHQEPDDNAEPGDALQAPPVAEQPRANRVLVLSDEDDNEEEQDDPFPQQDPGKRKDGAAVPGGRRAKRRRESVQSRDRSVKEALDKILKINREQDQTYRQEMAAARQVDTERGKEELDTMKQMIELTRMQMEHQREEAERRERREREQREREDRKWTMFFSAYARQPGPFQQFPPTASQPGYNAHQHTSFPQRGNHQQYTPAPAPAPVPATATYTPTSHRHDRQPTPSVHIQPQNDAEVNKMKKTYHTL